MEVCILAFLVLFVRSPSPLFFLGFLFWSVLTLACLARGLDRCPRGGALMNIFHVLREAPWPEPASWHTSLNPCPSGTAIRSAGSWPVAPATRIRKNKSFLTNFCSSQTPPVQRRPRQAPGNARLAKRKLLQAHQAKLSLHDYIKRWYHNATQGR